ncbi:dead deah box helicase domain-containing protein [Cyclospora cayetanensis]|uniref:Dead deah box helicase domain-containing protein n=1 Tax=Cyclospora cayetanensis TaxID=88456 RepID=A0A1D3D171_9EIME|nr:dead deah box helicase domain-containing protein [Cyclospora cayetanensis]
MDEADKLLCPEYAEEISRLLAAAPKEKVVLLFSATMTSSVCKLNKACLVKPIKVSVDKKTATAPVLLQQFLLLPLKHKWTYAAALLQQHRSFNSIMIFTNTCLAARKLATYLRHMAFDAVCLHGQMTQPQRIGALAKFRAGEVRILVTTEVGSRGLDISQVEFVLNFDVPLSSKDYIHRHAPPRLPIEIADAALPPFGAANEVVGRTARAGRSGRALTFVTQYDVEAYQRIEFALEKKLEEYAVRVSPGVFCKSASAAAQLSSRPTLPFFTLLAVLMFSLHYHPVVLWSPLWTLLCPFPLPPYGCFLAPATLLPIFLPAPPIAPAFSLFLFPSACWCIRSRVGAFPAGCLQDLPEEKALAFHERALEALRETELELHEAQEARSNKKRKHNQTNRKRKA